MAYEKVADLSTDTVHKIGGFNEKTQKPNPTKMEGFYLGSRTVATSTGTSTIHVFQTPSGNEGVWGTADLNNKLGSVNLGTMTLITYNGKKKLAGGKTKHSYDVAQDKEQTISVPKLTAGTQNAVTEPSDSEDDSYEADDSVDEDEVQAAALQAAERKAAAKAKVQAMLNKNKVG